MKPINPIRYITQSGVSGWEGTDGDDSCGDDDDPCAAGDDDPCAAGDDDPCAGDGSDWAGGDSVAKALIALQALEVPKPVALTFQ